MPYLNDDMLENLLGLSMQFKDLFLFHMEKKILFVCVQATNSVPQNLSSIDKEKQTALASTQSPISETSVSARLSFTNSGFQFTFNKRLSFANHRDSRQNTTIIMPIEIVADLNTHFDSIAIDIHSHTQKNPRQP